MTIHDATEVAYKNGYEAGKRDAMKWIPVTKRLPKDDVRVLVLHDDGVVRIGVSKLGFPAVVGKNNGKPFGITDVTHWMHLPEAPKEDA